MADFMSLLSQDMSLQTVYTHPLSLAHSSCNHYWPTLQLSWVQIRKR